MSTQDSGARRSARIGQQSFWRWTFWTFLSLHALSWSALAALIYANAGPHDFATCWTLILIYIPPIAFVLFVIAACSVVVLLTALFYPPLRATRFVLPASHGLIVTLGLIICLRSSAAFVGQPNCL
jgi:hypothetical protein